jgi:hypothetical protein
LNDPEITWWRTFPECVPPGPMASPRGPRHRPGAAPGGATGLEAVDVERHRPGSRRRAGAHARRSALAPADHGLPDRALARAAAPQMKASACTALTSPPCADARMAEPRRREVSRPRLRREPSNTEKRRTWFEHNHFQNWFPLFGIMLYCRRGPSEGSRRFDSRNAEKARNSRGCASRHRLSPSAPRITGSRRERSLHGPRHHEELHRPYASEQDLGASALPPVL